MSHIWWQNAVVYQIYPRSFYDGNGDGIGDLTGIMEKLDYLAGLGIDVIWISPVYESPMDDNGYDIADYQNIASEFGSMEEMKLLIQKAKEKGIEILMDLVINHSSDEHAWFIESKSDRENPKRDWYIWRNPKEDGTPPNNLRAIFGGSCWTYDEKTSQYYFHSFSKKQPDLNWENRELRRELYQMVRWWLEQGIAGFRVDAITFIKKPEMFEDVTPDEADGTAVVKPNNPGIGEFLKELKEEAFDVYDALTVAEAPGVTKEELPEFIGEDGYFSMLIEFDHVDLDIDDSGRWYRTQSWKLEDFKKAVSASQEIVNKTGWSALYLENHDQPRSLNKFIPEKDRGLISAKLLATMYFFLRGTPFIYQGQEIGMTNVRYDSIAEYDDLSTIDQYEAALREGIPEEKAYELVTNRSRDNSRTPMQWSEEVHGGFSSADPWLKANDNYDRINVAQSLDDEDSLLYYYKDLIDLRKNSVHSHVFVHGIFENVSEDYPDIFAYSRRLPQKEVIIVGSFSDRSQYYKLKGKVSKKITGNYEGLNLSNGLLELRPYEAVVLELV
ncbi:alpha-glucosidase [Alkalicoccus halolimnae]|uniref:Alpha-glucosidase n=1 Tax=Alkalicoccus halolimnae TaxID=1667239 RepID=A0A5C7FG91_9BACI|nr:alpha-glucosidase [Alkalicoccus halolimnae]TXF83606.1 alpha-glucosidase [Alkalicoccus halolimnae]